MKNSIIFIAGLALGIFATIMVNVYLSGNEYVTLDKDYSLSNGGLLKNGTKIKFNGIFPEGFTQYQMYLNIPNWTEDELITKKEKYAIIPYWLESKVNTFPYTECDSIFENGKNLPKFIGGDKKLVEFNLNNILPIIQRYGNANNENLISKLIYSLVISKEGKVLSAVIESNVNEGLKERIENSLLQMPNWIPGRVNGKIECMKIKIPVSCINWE